MNILNEKPSLTKREQEVLKCIISGDSNPEIARKLVISDNTAKAHVSNILYKLNAKNRIEAVVLAIKSDIIRL